MDIKDTLKRIKKALQFSITDAATLVSTPIDTLQEVFNEDASYQLDNLQELLNNLLDARRRLLNIEESINRPPEPKIRERHGGRVLQDVEGTIPFNPAGETASISPEEEMEV